MSAVLKRIDALIDGINECIGIYQFEWYSTQSDIKALYATIKSKIDNESLIDIQNIENNQCIDDGKDKDDLSKNDVIACNVNLFYNRLIYFWSMLKLNGYFDEDINNANNKHNVGRIFFYDGGITFDSPYKCRNIFEYYDLQMLHAKTFINNDKIFPINKNEDGGYPLNFEFMMKMIIARLMPCFVYLLKYHLDNLSKMDDNNNKIINTFRYMITWIYDNELLTFTIAGSKQLFQDMIQQYVGMKYTKTKEKHRRIQQQMNDSTRL